MRRGKKVTLDVSAEFLADLRAGLERKGLRPEGVVMAIRRPGGRFLVAGKTFYPYGTLRLMSGGVLHGETPREAFERELREETGFSPEGAELLGTVKHALRAPRDRLEYTHHIFLVPERAEDPQPEDVGEQLTDFQDASRDDLRRIACHLRNLAQDWSSWGRFRAEAIDFLLEETDG